MKKLFVEQFVGVLDQGSGEYLGEADSEGANQLPDFLLPEEKRRGRSLGRDNRPAAILIIGGDRYDTKKNWYYIDAVCAVYKLYGNPENIGYFTAIRAPTDSRGSVAFE